MSKAKWTYHGGGVLSKPRADGKTVYYVKYQRNGEPVFERVGLSEDAARARREARRDQASDPLWIPPTVKKREVRKAEQAAKVAAKAAAKPAHTVADLIAVYRLECAPAKRRQDWQTWMLTAVETELGTVALADVTPERIEAWRDRLSTEVLSDKDGKEKVRSASTVRKYVYFLSGIYQDCMRTSAGRKLVTENPCRLVSLPAEPTGLKRALTADQAAAVLRAAQGDSTIYRWAGLILRTGMRVEEAQGLTWEHVELERRGKVLTGARFAVHETKTGKPRIVEAGDQLLPDLGKWHKADKGDGPGPTGPVIGESFVGEKGKVVFPYDRWRDVFKAAGIPWGTERGQFTTRNLRTTFCMLAFQNGARPEELVLQTGHSMETLFGFYAEASNTQRLRAVNALPDLKRRTLKAVK